jgi:HTH-type transcriptional regulator/antitoxin HigA
MYQPEIKSFEAFIKPLMSLINISNEDDYEKAQEFMGELFDACKDEEGDPLLPLIDILASSIEKYERRDEDLVKFINKANDIPTHIATLNVLMDQYGLTRDDLPEIGDKSMVSRVLNNKRPLTKSAIEKLCSRFNIRPDYLFSIKRIRREALVAGT